MSQNIEWKDIRATFLLRPITTTRCPLQRFNILEVANSITTKNFKDRLVNEDEINLLDVVRKKITRENQIRKPEPAASINIHCDSLKSVFMDHEAKTTVNKAVAKNPIKRQTGFISSYMIEKLSDSSTEAGEVIDEKESTNENKQLITKDVLDEWLKELYSVSTSKNNPKDCGVFPTALSLTTSSKKVAKKNQQQKQLDSLIPT
jgi:hypothetical protein